MQLSRQQDRVAGLIACGMAIKEVADALHVKVPTVSNTLQTIYNKTGLGKTNELTAWWLIHHFKLSIDLGEVKKQLIATCLLLLVIFQMTVDGKNIQRAWRTRSRKTDTEISITA